MKKSRIIHALAVLLTAGYLFSCSESNLGTGSNSEQLAAGNVHAVAAKKSHGDSPQKVFEEFRQMVKKVETMSKAEIDSLSDEEVLVLGEPIVKATEGTVKLNKGALQKLKAPIGELFARSKTMTKAEHKTFSKEIEQIIASARNRETRSFGANDVRNLLLKFNGEQTMLSSTCEQMFTMQGDRVILMPGDNFNLANIYCPAGTLYYVTGTHYGQYVNSSKTGNSWVGGGSAVMDGQNSVNRAFNGGMNSNNISWIEIKDYKEYGIFSDSGTDDLLISNMSFNEIGDGKNGQDYGAIQFDYAEGVRISDSYFEDVSSSIRFRFSDGPIEVLDNEALNSGRNFFQCNDCNGAGIRINDNSMDRTSSYGSEPLEDWISIFDSEGTSGNWIQVKHNRARGHSNSEYGSFIILGDEGGKYQEAIGNIGVSPGQVGIGAAGGKYLRVQENIMYSEPWTHASQGFYSANYSGLNDSTCDHHEFPGPVNFIPNKADWNDTPIDRAWASGECGIDVFAIRDSVVYDSTIDEDVWNDW